MRIEGRRGRAHSGEHAAPVGVVAEDSALEEIVAGDGARHLEGVGFGCRRTDLDRDVVLGALGIGDQLSGQRGAHPRDGRRELSF